MIGTRCKASIVIPAHNEARVIGRLLSALCTGATPGEFDIVVVSNGSSDDTAAIATGFPGVRVVELAEGSKHLALVAGDAAAATTFPRLYVDADVSIDLTGIRALCTALKDPAIEVAAPLRINDTRACSRLVRSYFAVWEQLPVVRDGLFGRGVIAVSEAGFARIAERPAVLGDDLWMHSRFEPEHRAIVAAAESVVRAPRTTGDLLRRRTRAAQGNDELAARTAGATATTSSTVRDVVHLACSHPGSVLDVAVFLALTAVARIRGRRMLARGDTRWLRDESSRTAG